MSRDTYPGQAPCPACFESSGYMGRVNPATWTDPAWEDADPTRPCSYCNGTGTVDSPLVTLDDLENEAAEQAAAQPRRCDTNLVGGAGECLACDAEQGVHCRATNPDNQTKRG